MIPNHAALDLTEYLRNLFKSTWSERHKRGDVWKYGVNTNTWSRSRPCQRHILVFRAVARSTAAGSGNGHDTCRWSPGDGVYRSTNGGQVGLQSTLSFLQFCHNLDIFSQRRVEIHTALDGRYSDRSYKSRHVLYITGWDCGAVTTSQTPIPERLYTGSFRI